MSRGNPTRRGAAVNGPTVETTAGLVEGVERHGTMQFLGVPFATAARFRRPQPAPPWDGVRRADASTASPPQLPSPLPFDVADLPPGDEDCLQLDIFTPATDGEKRPVLVWFFGGGFTMGAAAVYDGSSLARRGDVVVVTVNYRLGALGFSYLEHLDEQYAGSANAGLHDQIASLEWVRDNIGGFGGDPGCVTIFGESAGGHSVGCLLTSGNADGLFHRCILESSSGWGLRTPEWAQEVTTQLMTKLGVATVEELEAVDVDTLLSAQASTAMRMPDGSAGGPRTQGVAAFPFAPTLDGGLISGHVVDEIASGRVAEVPVLLCHTRDEIKLFAAMGFLPDPANEAELAAMMTMGLPDGPAAVEAYRRAQPDGSLSDWFVSFLTDQTYHMPDFRFADERVRHDPRVWMARFSWSSPAEGSPYGACHGIEIPFVFHVAGQTGGFLDGVEAPTDVAFAMQDAWAAFARSGDPNCTAVPTWPRYDVDTRAVMSVDTKSEVVDDPDAGLRILWQDVRL